ncbi:uncharacterized protein [Littorina saxatilis]|uniref:uncharacterized protein n=1 Tax=Littorina saxatilis TaxID=31220 RepID=UPI0038B429BA
MNTGGKTDPEKGKNTGGKTYPKKEKNTGGKTDPEKGKNTGGKTYPKKEKNTGGKTDPEKGKNTGGKTYPKKEKNTGGKTDPEKGKNTGGKTDPEKGKNTGGKTDPEKGKNTGGKTDPEKGKNTGGKTDPKKEKITGGKTYPKKEKNTGGKTYPKKGKNTGGKTDPEKEKNTGGKTDPEKGKNTGGKTDPEKEKNTGGKTYHEKEKNTGGKTDPEKEKNTGGKTDPEKEKNTGGKTDPEKEKITGGDMAIYPEAGFDGGDGCLAKMKCAMDKLPEGSDIMSVRLYHETARNQTRIHTLLAEADDQSKMMFRDHVQMSNAGAFFTKNLAPVCLGTVSCMDTTTYFIYPVQEKNLGPKRWYSTPRRTTGKVAAQGTEASSHIASGETEHDFIQNTMGGVWENFGNWSPEQCKGCVQERRPERCLTKHCKGPAPVQRRRCSQDGVCDETVRINIHTESVNADRCRAKIQCKVPYHVTSVQLFYVWGPTKAVWSTGYTDVDYTGSILLAEATAGVNGGRFTEKAVNPYGGVDPDIPSDPQLCSCTDNCREYYTYTLDTVNPGNVGDYACVIQPGSVDFDYAARLSFSDDCPRPSNETVREENCEQNCLKTYMVEGHEKYIKYYCHKLCEVDEEVKESGSA